MIVFLVSRVIGNAYPNSVLRVQNTELLLLWKQRPCFVRRLINSIVSLLYKLAVNCCQLCKLSLLIAQFFLIFQWRAVIREPLRVAASEERFILSVC